MARMLVERDPAMQEKAKTDYNSRADRSTTTASSDHNHHHHHCFRPVSGSLIPSEKFDPSVVVHPAILRSLSSSPLPNMSRNPSETSVSCVHHADAAADSSSSLEDPSFRATETSTIPRRNLTEAFEELYIEPSSNNNDVDTPMVKQLSQKQAVSSVISPTGVADFRHDLADDYATPCKANGDPSSALPHFVLHEDLKRELSDAVVDRVSFYAVIHDINKEAFTMASMDDSGYNRNPEDLHEPYDPLVVAVNGKPKDPLPPSRSMIYAALVDEERWLLETIESRDNEETRGSVKDCPPTFLQAMGEREYENPLTSLSSGSRTQLWKPSRSWWEAKSGKNPWIEPKSHNKRWRYLWPLIHYHKFLARCIKKLKRNGVDVKTSVSPVAVFLREEVCAVSDHLASVSLFDSDKWMDCLGRFHGWTDTSPEAEEHLRSLVAQLRLRPLFEPGDIDSPLLRSQIDEQYLRAMASARSQMAGNGSENERRTPKDSSSSKANHHQTPETKSKKNVSSHVSSGHPPAYPRQNGSSPLHRGPNGGKNGPSQPNMQRPHYGYPPQHAQWYNGWNPHGMYYGDDNAQPVSSGEGFPPPYDMSMYPPGAMPHPQFYHPHALMYPPHQAPPMQPGVYNPAMHPPGFAPEAYASEQYDAAAWTGQPQGDAGQQGAGSAPMEPGTPGPHGDNDCGMTSYPTTTQYGDQPTPQAHMEGDHTPYKYNPSSPYWGHLDQTTLAMMGIASPQGMGGPPQTPSRAMRSSPEATGAETGEDANSNCVNAQPLLLRQQYPTYSYYGNTEGYGPASPATQFMMSPQANFAYGYGAYSGFSPNHTSSPPRSSPGGRKRRPTTPHVEVPKPVATPSRTETGIQTDSGESARENSA